MVARLTTLGSAQNFFYSGGRYDPSDRYLGGHHLGECPRGAHRAPGGLDRFAHDHLGRRSDGPFRLPARPGVATTRPAIRGLPTTPTMRRPLAPSHTAVWTGAEMIIWGGADRFFGEVPTGGRYSPATDSWQPTTLARRPRFHDDRTPRSGPAKKWSSGGAAAGSFIFNQRWPLSTRRGIPGRRLPRVARRRREADTALSGPGQE